MEKIIKRGVTLGELIAATITICVAVASYWISTERRLTILESQMSEMRELKMEMRADMKEVRRDVSDIKADVKLLIEKNK